MADYKINSVNHLFSGAPNNMPSTTYASGNKLPNQATRRAQAKTQTGGNVSFPYFTSPVNNRREAMKSESMKRAAIRREAIKSENLKEPLVVCPTCGLKLSLDTEECPNCCHKIKPKMDDNKKTLILLIIALLILLIPFIKKSEFDGSKIQDDINSFFSEIEDSFNEFIEDSMDYDDFF